MSYVNVYAVEPALTFPATSVWRTYTVFVPCVSTGALALQLVPSPEYCTVAPASVPATLSVPTFVILSVPLDPLSLVKPTVGAATTVSTVTENGADTAPVCPRWDTVAVTLKVPSPRVDIVAAGTITEALPFVMSVDVRV